MTLRVATYNLYLGADLSPVLVASDAEEAHRAVAEAMRQLEVTDFASRARAIARLLVSEQVDLVGLQEVTVWMRNDTVVADFQRDLVDALAELDSPYDVHAAGPSFSGSGPIAEGEEMSLQGHNAILVRRGAGIEVQAERTGDFEAALIVPTRFGAFGIARSWGWVDVLVDGRPLRFVNTHTEAYDVQTRDRQRDELLAVIGDPGRPVVLVGDFNALPEAVGVGQPYVDAWIEAGGDPSGGFTCGQAADLGNDASSLSGRIDYVWVRDAAVAGCRLIGAEAGDRTDSGLWPSDHAGVVAEVVVASGRERLTARGRS
jgi:endonuclease/exonuclease/phosphatase family metal-dependent hydrolase